MSSRILLSMAAVALVALSGCASKVAGLKQDKSFTYESVASGKMAIGGVTSYSGLDDTTQAKYGGMLRTMLLEERETYEIAPVGAVKGQIGADEYHAMMDNFGSMGSLDQAGADALSKVRAARYVMFCIIEGDDVSNTRDTTYDTDKKGKKVSGTDKIVKVASRTVTASLSIYDTKNGKRVWSGSVTKVGKKSATFEPESENLLVAIVKAANKDETSDDERYPPPEAPPSEKVLNMVFTGFAENMPDS